MSNMGSPGDISRSRTQSNMAAREGTRRSVRGQLERTPTQLPVAQALSRKESSTHGDKGHGKHPHKLGMFKGVLVPTCENMWGVIIFLRFYTIVGYAGIGLTIVIVTISFLVAFSTALALSAIATCGSSHNLAGVYPMLARALGKEIATATGLIYFLGITCLAVLECLGATEELFMVAPSLKDIIPGFGPQLWGSIFMITLTVFVGGGIQIVSKLGLAFFVVVIATLLFYYVSLLGAPNLTSLECNPVCSPPAHHRMLWEGPPSPYEFSGGAGDEEDYAVDTEPVAGAMMATMASWFGPPSATHDTTSHHGAARMLGATDPGSGSNISASGSAHGSGHTTYNLGLSMDNFRNNFGPSFSGDYYFPQTLSVFFPCFTGILSGANRASSLRDPTTAIPNGTLGAICFSYFMYLSMLILWAGVGPREYLQMAHGQIDVLFWPSVVMGQVGIIVSSLGQALQCLVVAPRLLASIAESGAISRLKPLGKKIGGEPKFALLTTYVIGNCLCMLGSLNLIAPLLSMCFLLCYACMNFNSFILDILKDPHWRPKWRWFHWSVGLFGFILCVTTMFLISILYAVIAWVMMILLLLYIVRTSINFDYGSALTGIRFHVAIRALLSVDMKSHLDTNWKPQLLLLYTLREVEQLENKQEYDAGTGLDADRTSFLAQQAELGAAPEDVELGGSLHDGGVKRVPLDTNGDGRIDSYGTDTTGDGHLDTIVPVDKVAVGHTHEHMFAVAHQLRHGSGLIIAAAIMQMPPGQANHDLEPVIAAEEEEQVMSSLMKDAGVQGFAMTVLTHDATEGKAYAIQCAGLGPLTPNTVLMGWPWWWKSNPKKFVPEFMSTIHQATLRQKALLVCHNLKDFPSNDEPQSGFIDIWWIKHDGGLLLLISHLLQKHRVWRRCTLRLHLITEMGTDPNLLKERIHKLLSRINITAIVENVIQIDNDSLLPYMNASRDRARNQAKREGNEATEHDTAESMLLADPDVFDEKITHLRKKSVVGHIGLRRNSADKSQHGIDLESAGIDRSGSALKSDGFMLDRNLSANDLNAMQRMAQSDAYGCSSAPFQRSASAGGIRRSSAPGVTGAPAPLAAGPAALLKPFDHLQNVTSPAAMASPNEAAPAPSTPPPSPPGYDDVDAPPAPEGRLEKAVCNVLQKELSAFIERHHLLEKRRINLPSTSDQMHITPPPSPPEGGDSSNPDSRNSSSYPNSPKQGAASSGNSPTSTENPKSPPKEAQPQRWSLLGGSAKWGSRDKLPPSITLDDDGQGTDPSDKSPGREGSAAKRRSSDRRGSPPPARASDRSPPHGPVSAGSKVGFLTGGPRSSSRKDAAAAFTTPGNGNDEHSSGNEEEVISGVLQKELSSFMEKYQLNPEATEELKEIFQTSVKKVKAELEAPGPRCRWDQIHEMIKSHSPGTSLVIVNLPDPPDLPHEEEQVSEEDQMNEMLEYMNYMEGVAEALPRVLYVHGSGQEVISLDSIAD